MDKHRIRQDQTCKNCKHVVEKRYCSNCGQENTETRQSFTHLVKHFVQDFTHYDNAFWTTIKFLLFHPGRLTREFLSGKRQCFVPPVKLYIFISFLTFFLLSVLATPNAEDDIIHVKAAPEDATVSSDPMFKNLRAFDSIQSSLAQEDRMPKPFAWLSRKWLTLQENHTNEEIQIELTRSVMGNLPKVLFLFMPFSAFALWLFHSKKRWYYFDHGIFTLHYFSFVLLTFSALSIWVRISDYLGDFVSSLDDFFFMAVMIWWFFYFFRSHRRFYGESKLISRLKSFGLFIINIFFITIFLIALFIYSIVNIQ